MQATARISRFSWRFAMVVGIAAVALGIARSAARFPHPACRQRRPDRQPAVRRPDPRPRAELDRCLGHHPDRATVHRHREGLYGRGPRLPRHLRPDGSPALRDPLDHRQPSPVGAHGAVRSRGRSITGSDRGGTLREAYTNLCGATAMMRAYDQARHLEQLADRRTRLCGLRRAPQRPPLAPGRPHDWRPRRGVTHTQRVVTTSARTGDANDGVPGFINKKCRPCLNSGERISR